MINEESESKTVTRRTLLRKLAITALVPTGIATVIKKEDEFSQLWIDTPDGLFLGIYERHSKGIEPADIPDEIDIIFEEFMSPNLYDDNPQKLLNSKFALSDGGEELLFKNSVLEKLINNHITIAFGDTSLNQDILEKINWIENARLYSGLVVLGGSVGFSVQNDRPSKEGEQLDSEVKQPNLVLTHSRRKFLRNLLGGAGLLLTVPLLPDLLFIKEFLVNNIDGKQKDAFSRILHRAEGLVIHFRPEDHLVFFRNLLMADKLLTIAEANKQRLRRKTKIAFNVGSAHSGIEDFLWMGHDFCRGLISAYPKNFLEEIVKINGNLENLCAVKAVSIPLEISVDDIRKDEVNSEVLDIPSERIVDSLLYESLISRLN